jgi:hypothetical protein
MPPPIPPNPAKNQELSRELLFQTMQIGDLFVFLTGLRIKIT